MRARRKSGGRLVAGTLLTALLIALSSVFGQSKATGTGEAEAEADAATAIATCAACHGVDGISVKQGVPHLAGQPRAYIANQLQIFRRDQEESAGTRWLVHRTSRLMHDRASRLSDTAIQEIAAHFSAMPCTVEPANAPVLKPMIANRCLACHDGALTGRRPLTLVPNLAGQRADYLIAQMDRMRSDGADDQARNHVMMSRQAPISDTEIVALAEYFESLGCAAR